jgi:Na+-transporting methylmalonyl-CoA/oxaloacetate decarboxylase gamma subunit
MVYPCALLASAFSAAALLAATCAYASAAALFLLLVNCSRMLAAVDATRAGWMEMPLLLMHTGSAVLLPLLLLLLPVIWLVSSSITSCRQRSAAASCNMNTAASVQRGITCSVAGMSIIKLVAL